MERHAQEAMSLDDVAAHAGLSPSHLIRCFKRQYAITPHGFLTDCRIRRAKRELLLGYPLAEVALRCRFADQAHFQRTFKRLTAATPRQYVLSAGQSPGRWPQAAPPAGD
jgi:AraC-like DNA-binding protein